MSYIELGIDCEIIVKICDDLDCWFIKKLKSIDIVNRAEWARAYIVKSTLSLSLASYIFTAI